MLLWWNQVAFGKVDPILGHDAALYVFTLLPTLCYYVSVSMIGHLELGPVVGGYIGLLLVGAVFLAVSIVGSAMTENQVVAFIVSFLIVFGLFMLDKVLIYLPGSLASVFEYISVDYHFSNIARGVIDSRDLIYYGSAVTFLLMLGTAILQKRRWS